MSQKVAHIHEDIFTLLLQEYKNYKKEFFFTLRRTNRFQRLDHRYWFHGNDNYIAVSFWSGFDYANKTPNISFIVFPEDGSSLIELTAVDSKYKFEFFSTELIPAMKHRSFEKVKKWKYQSWNPEKDYLTALRDFIDTEKKIIDRLIERHKKGFGEVPERDSLRPILKSDFTYALRRILTRRESMSDEISSRLPVTLKRIQVNDFGPIQNRVIDSLDSHIQFIFLTGENGGGKTSLLRSIALGMTNDHHTMLEEDRNYSRDTGHYDVEIEIQQGQRTRKNRTRAINGKEHPIILGGGFAAYGPHRLVTTESEKGLRPVAEGLEEMFIGNKGINYSLFHDDGVLMDVWDAFGVWNKQHKSARVKKWIESIRTTLHDLNDKLKYVYFPGEIGVDQETTHYQEQDSNQNAFPPVEFRNLASGTRSLIAMFGDMMLRLFQQQPKCEEASDLKLIVLIDEIDLHLHPKLQLKLIEQLKGTFPLIQFVVSTHSPIPFLAAPLSSRIYTVNRKLPGGVVIKELEFSDFRNLLPNTLLTSPIFDLNSLTPFSNIDVERLNTDNDYKESILMSVLDKEVDKLFDASKWDSSGLFDEQ